MSSESSVFRLKNVGGDGPRVVYDVQGKPRTIRPGETLEVELRVKEAARIAKLSHRGGDLRVINESDAVMRPEKEEYRDRQGKLLNEAKPGATKVTRAHQDPAPEEPKIIRPEIKTATQALNAMDDGEELPWSQFQSVAARILGDDMPKRRTKVEIRKALSIRAKKER